MIDNKDGHIPSLLIVLTCATLRHGLLEWQTNKLVHPEVSKSKLKADGPDHSNNFNDKDDGGMSATCSAATGRKWLTSPVIADTYIFLLNSWNTLLQSYPQRVYETLLLQSSIGSN